MSPRRSLRAFLLALAVGFALAPACKPGGRGGQAPTSAPTDATAGLPPFSIAPEGPRADDPRAVPHERFHVTLGDAPVRGPTTAPVTVVMFSDFECPFCRQGHEVIEHLQKKYRGRLRVAYKAFPLDIHGNALLAALAARSAQAQGKFWPLHDLMFGRDGLDWPTVLRYAAAVGLDVPRIQREADALTHAAAIQRDLRQARRFGVSSTPTFFVNGRHVRGAKSAEVFEALVEEELELAERWRKAGIRPEAIYDHAIAEGYRRVRYTAARDIDPDGVFEVPIGDSPTLGPAEAPVTIVIFGDFQCPFCARGHGTIEQVRHRYGDRVRLVYKHCPLPFHSQAFVAARASQAAHAQGRFWRYHDALYALGARFEEADLHTLAKRQGLDLKAFKSAMQSTALDARIADDLALARKLGVTGTPAYFVNGRPIEGAMPELHFYLMVEEELERAAKAVARGVAPAKVYETLSHEPLADP